MTTKKRSKKDILFGKMVDELTQDITVMKMAGEDDTESYKRKLSIIQEVVKL